MPAYQPDLYPCASQRPACHPLIDLRKSASNKNFGRLLSMVAAPVHHLLSIERINAIYRSLPSESVPNEFCRKGLAALGVDYAVTETEIARIPAQGPLVVVSNHPYGGLEGIILAEILLQVRGDVRILGNYLLTRIPQLAPKIIPVDPFQPGRDGRNIGALRQAMRWLKGGGALLVFPAGEVSHWRPGTAGVADPPWSPHIGHMIRTLKTKVLPVYIHGRNSLLFQLAGLIHPLLRTILLPRELVNKNGRPIEVNIGNALSWQRLIDFASDQETVDFLRFHTYLLRHRKETRPNRVRPRIGPRVKRLRPVVAPVPKAALEAEIEALAAQNRLVVQNDYQVYVTTADESPAIVREIGRLREISFREVGEGTGRSIDIDRYDRHYRQLFLWNRQTREIVGAYRIGQTDQILADLGPAGLYSSTLFDYKPPFMDFMGNALELGRSFIRAEYQRKFGCLTLLWRGIGELIARNPAYRYLFGPVSISHNYHRISKHLMVEFLRRHMLEPGLAAMVKPRCPHKTKGAFLRAILHDCGSHVSLEDISMLIAEIEKDQKGIPVLVKHYLKLNGKFLAFNVDRAFANVIDGLVFVDLLKTDPKILQRFLGAQGVACFYAQHAAQARPMAA